MKNPNQVIDQNSLLHNNQPSFWNDVATGVRQNRPPLPPDSIGWFQVESPYMHRSAWHGLRFLFSALENRFSVELYAYLDGVHLGHTGQGPTESENIGRGLLELCDQAGKSGLTSGSLPATGVLPHGVTVLGRREGCHCLSLRRQTV